MKTLITAACAWAFALGAHAAPPNPAHESALRALAAAADDAWDLKDADLMAGYYATDATLIVGGAPTPIQGRAGIKAYFQQTFANRAGTMRHVSELRTMDMVSPDLAVTDLWVRVEVQQPDGGWKEVRRFNNLSIAKHEGDGWKLRAVRAYPVG